jgi:hypothetical protein
VGCALIIALIGAMRINAYVNSIDLDTLKLIPERGLRGIGRLAYVLSGNSNSS